MFVTNYIARIKDKCDSLASIKWPSRRRKWCRSVSMGWRLSLDHSKRLFARERIRRHSSSCSWCFSLKRTTHVHQRVRTSTARWCTRRKIGPMVLVDEGGQHTMEAADRSKTEGIIKTSTTIPSSPEIGESRHLETERGMIYWFQGLEAY